MVASGTLIKTTWQVAKPLAVLVSSSVKHVAYHLEGWFCSPQIIKIKMYTYEPGRL